ncbi:MAG: biotin/lipoate A/B protein ligase family protein [Candidatus Thorarchaeota archaeon]
MMDSTWRLIVSKETDPMWNLAVDEAILRGVIDNDSPNTVRIWQSSESVIIGRSQDLRAEVNLKLCHELCIPILRRCSGGGTVYLDLGNYNYSIVAHEKIINKKKTITNIIPFLCSAIVDLLSQLGCNSKFVPPSNVFVEDWKLSGSAQYYLYEGILHHGTLLVNADLEMLRKVLTPNPTLAGHLGCVPSTPSPVTNLSFLLRRVLHPKEVTNLLVQAIINILRTDNWGYGSINRSENELTKMLLDIKYSDSNWLLGI